jgi:hypothetical protein
MTHTVQTGGVGTMINPSRNDCGITTLALLRESPGTRGFVGACIVCGGRSRLTHQLVPGLALPWNHHVWAISPDGALIDPTVADLMTKELHDWYEPRIPLQEMQPKILWSRSEQDAVLAELRPLAIYDPRPFLPVGSDRQLLYLPGRIAPSRKLGWQRLAKKSKGPRGFSAADLDQVLSRSLDKPQRSPRSAWGFAELVD